MKKDDIVEALANNATEGASQKDLLEFYYDDQEAYFNELPLSELKEWAVDLGLMKEDEEIE